MLGPFQAMIEGTAVSAFPTDKTRALLAYLAMQPGQPHRRERLAGLFWPDQADIDARRNLRKSLHHLRQTLDAHTSGLDQALLESTHQTVELLPEALDLDVRRFETLVKTSQKHNHPALDECQECMERLEEAATLYRGEFMEGFSLSGEQLFNEWALVVREQLHQLFMQSAGRLAEAFEQTGEYERAAYYAAQQLRYEPWLETAMRQWLRALALSGRRGEAASKYREFQEILRLELGVEASEETRQLYEQILNGSYSSQNARKRQDAKARPQAHNFPTQFTAFVGRQAELERLVEDLQRPECRLLSLIGPGGVGKTRLAIQVALTLAQERESAAGIFADGIYFAPLSSVPAAGALEKAIASSLGIHFREAGSPRQQLLEQLKHKRLLFVFDGLERQANDTAWIGDLLQEAPGMKIMTTTREPLYLKIEERFNVEGLENLEISKAADQAGGQEQEKPLSDYAAIQLFIAAARRVMPNFDPQGTDLYKVALVCRLLQGFPLAIEIAAAWVRLYNPIQMAEEIANNPDFLVTPLQDVPERHRSMRVVFEHSWQQLSTDEQRALAQMAVFQGGFTLKAAVTVTQTSVLHLSALFDRALLRRTGADRFELHELLRQFALEKLQAGGGFRPAETVYQTHSQYYLHLLAGMEGEFFGRHPRKALDAVHLEIDNIRQAWDWAVHQRETASIAACLDSLCAFYQFYGLFQEAEELLALGIGQYGEQVNETLGKLHAQRAEFLIKLGDYAQARPVALDGLRLAETSGGGVEERTRARLALGRVMEMTGEYEAGEKTLRLTLEDLQKDEQQSYQTAQGAQVLPGGAGSAARRASRLRCEALTYNRLGRIIWRRGNNPEALAHYQKALEIEQGLGNLMGIARNYNDMGLVYKVESAYAQALECFERGMQFARQLGYREDLAKNLNNSGMVYWQMGNLDQAYTCYTQALEIARDLNHLRGAHICLGNMGIIFHEKGAYQAALEHYHEALTIAQELGYRLGVATMLGNIGNIHREQGEFAQARDYYERALHIYQEIDEREGVARLLGYFESLHRESGEYERALEYAVQSIHVLRELKARYYLTWQLIDQAEILCRLGRLEEAQISNAEGLNIALEINRQEYIFLGELMQARLDFARGARAAAITRLYKMLEEQGQKQTNALINKAHSTTRREQAALYYELWEMHKGADDVDGSAEDQAATQALAIYEQLYQETPHAEYHQRIMMLKRS